jgi:hypothetical protein
MMAKTVVLETAKSPDEYGIPNTFSNYLCLVPSYTGRFTNCEAQHVRLLQA